MSDDNDDLPVGRVLTRREALVLFGAAGAAILGAGASPSRTRGTARAQQASLTPVSYLPLVANAPLTPTPSPTATASPTATPTVTVTPSAATCVVRPAKTEGPYFVDEMLNRSDIRTEPTTGLARDGVPLTLTFRVSALSGGSCSALANAQVDLWHCDAQGVYSDVAGSSTDGLTFLRGYQRTDSIGLARFITIYPGWYPGRVTHIHFKIRATLANNATYEFTSQLFFSDDLTDTVYQNAAYVRSGTRDTRNNTDGIFGSNGGLLLLTCVPAGDGYAAQFDVSLAV